VGTHTANSRKLWDGRSTPLPRRKPGNPGGGVGPKLVNRPRGNMASGCDADIYGMGKLSIWARWLIIIAGVMLSPLLVVFMAGVISRSLFRKAWRLGRVAPRVRA
jgi:hypothetical protein